MNLKPVLSHLEKVIAFKTIVDSKSLHQAALKLRVSQPSLSATLKILEEQLGEQLLLRSHKGVALTIHGQILMDYAQAILKEHGLFERSWSQLDHEVSGELTVGIFDSIAVYFWPQFYRHFTKKYPLVRPHLSMGRSSELSKKLRSHDLDISITVNPVDAKGINSHFLYEDAFSFYVSKALSESSELSSDKSLPGILLTQEKLRDLELIIFPDSVSGLDKTYQNKVGIFDLKFARSIEVGSFEAARELCNAGLGIAMLPNRVADYSSTKLLRCRFSHLKETRFFSHGIFASISEKNSNQTAQARLLQELISYSR